MTKRLSTWADLHLINDWRNQWKRLWSLKVALFWSIIGGVILVAPLVSEEAKAVVGPWQFGGILFLASVSFAMARFTKQPGADE